MSLTTTCASSRPSERVLGRFSRTPVNDARERSQTFLLVGGGTTPDIPHLAGYRGLISPNPKTALSVTDPLLITDVKHTDQLESGDVLVAAGRQLRTLYRPNSSHNFLFATDRCNSNCLMCSQPPKDRDDSYLVEENLELLDLIVDPPRYLVITGGEPTLLGGGLLRILARLRDRFPDTPVLMLSNGRRFARHEVAQDFAAAAHSGIRVAVPLYSDFPQLHDYVVQADQAHDQTVLGLHNLARFGVSIEVRVVLHALTIPRLPKLAEFIYRTFPFADHIALMGLEMMGYTKKNLKELWIDPYDYQCELRQAVTGLAMRGMNVSIYNHQLCVLDTRLWPYARQSISDWKNVYLDECTKCSLKPQCGGFFASATTKHSAHITAA